MSGRASLASRAMSAAVSSTSSNTADQRTFASWFAPTTDSDVGVDEHAQRRRRLAPRQRGHAHVEAGRDELRPGDGHQLPRLVLAQDHLAAPGAARSRQRGQHALEAGGLVFEPGAARAGVDDRVLDRDELALGARREHGEMPRVAAVGRIEPHDQPFALAGDRARPLLDPRRDLARDAHGRVERAAVEAGDDGLGDVGDRADARRRSRQLEPARAVAADRVDHAGERRADQRPGVDLGIERAHDAGHALGETREPRRRR